MTTDVTFIPAETVAEAVARIYGLTGAQAKGGGEKRALVALRDALGVDVDVVRTNAVVAAALADRLGVEWDRAGFTDKNSVNLAGLNALLLGASHAFRRGELGAARPAGAGPLDGPEWAEFRPAISKIEAVTRVAALTGAPPETLGPGSKERKSVLENLAARMLSDHDVDSSSKTRLARDIATKLGVAWPDTAYSTGETISLEGLNLILAGAERRLGKLGSSAADALQLPQDEGRALLSALRDGLGDDVWDARSCISWMNRSGVRGAFDNEWQGFYFEARGREILNRSFVPSSRPPRTTYGNTTFDYALNHVWDLKAHTGEQVLPLSGVRRKAATDAFLNDVSAMRRCVADGGLGFLVLDGTAVMDEDTTFVTWHRAFKAANGVRTQRSNSGTSRTRKAAFSPLRLDAVWIPDTLALDSAVAAGHLKVAAQGRQAPAGDGAAGRPRNDKYMLRSEGRDALSVATSSWPSRPIDPLKADPSSEDQGSLW